MRCVGGPLDGYDLDTAAGIVLIERHEGRYVRWWDPPLLPPEQAGWTEMDYFMRDVPLPPKPERYLRWQEPGAFSDHPAVVAIRDAVAEAADRMR